MPSSWAFCTSMGLKMRGLLDLPHLSVVAPALGFQFCNLLSGAWCCTDSLEFGWAGKRDACSFVFEHLSVWVICADGSVVDGKRVRGAPLGLSYTIISLNFFLSCYTQPQVLSTTVGWGRTCVLANKNPLAPFLRGRACMQKRSTAFFLFPFLYPPFICMHLCMDAGSLV